MGVLRNLSLLSKKKSSQKHSPGSLSLESTLTAKKQGSPWVSGGHFTLSGDTDARSSFCRGWDHFREWQAGSPASSRCLPKSTGEARGLNSQQLSRHDHPVALDSSGPHPRPTRRPRGRRRRGWGACLMCRKLSGDGVWFAAPSDHRESF